MKKIRTLARLKARTLTKKEIKKVSGGVKMEKGLTSYSSHTFTGYIGSPSSDQDQNPDPGTCTIL